MKLIGFNINKINAERKENNFSDLKIENNIQIEEILSTKSDIFKKDEEIIQFKFLYKLNYKPDIASISFSGNILLLVDSKEAKNILKEWESKNISEEVKLAVFNIILRKTSIKSLELEDELNIPLHINIPSLKGKKKD